MLFSELPLDHRLKKILESKTFTELTEIQQRVIAPALQGGDVVASSKTGSGKTLAFLVPTIHRLLTTRALSKQDPRVLILAPTRELAKQVFIEAKALTTSLPLNCQLIVGGENYNDQIKILRRNPQIIVGTAGRIADHLDNKSFFINGLELLILDEADRMLDLGFAEKLLMIDRFADHRKRQTMMFSATIGRVTFDNLADQLLKTPTKVAVGSATEQHADIEQQLIFADNVAQKDRMLTQLLDDVEYNQAIVFVATRDDTERLASTLADSGRNAVALHAELAQNQRSNVMNAFAKGQQDVLVCTDVASRGLDLPRVELVINFDMPKQPEEFIHRIGRTGRAGKSGRAIALLGPRDWRSYVAVRALLDYDIPVLELEQHPSSFKGFDYVKQRKASLAATKSKRKPAAKAKVKKDNANRVKSMEGKDFGDMPMRRKKPKVEE